MTSLLIGDIKLSYQTSDHDGWYLMDGRSLASLDKPNKDDVKISEVYKSIFPNNDSVVLPDTRGVVLRIHRNIADATIQVDGKVQHSNSAQITEEMLPTDDIGLMTSGHTVVVNDQDRASGVGLVPVVLKAHMSTNIELLDPNAPRNYAPAIVVDPLPEIPFPGITPGQKGRETDITPQHMLCNHFVYLGEIVEPA